MKGGGENVKREKAQNRQEKKREGKKGRKEQKQLQFAWHPAKILTEGTQTYEKTKKTLGGGEK